MDKRQLLRRLDDAWSEFRHSYADLDEATLVEPGVAGEWSVRDLIAHVTTWEEEALKHLPDVLAGIRPPRYSVTYGGIDAFNAEMMRRKRDLSVEELLQHADDVHGRLVALVEGVSDHEVTHETRFRRRLRLDTYSHYPLHTQAIQQWRQRNETRTLL
jgi:hypothetical protein